MDLIPECDEPASGVARQNFLADLPYQGRVRSRSLELLNRCLSERDFYFAFVYLPMKIFVVVDRCEADVGLLVFIDKGRLDHTGNLDAQNICSSDRFFIEWSSP